MTNSKPKIVIVGAGFGGLNAAQSMRDISAEIMLIDAHNYHTFQPLLYQVATAALEPEEIAHSVRGLFHDQPNLSFRLAKVTDVDWTAKTLQTEAGESIPFDYAVFAAGAVTNDFGIEGIRDYAFPLKHLDEAVALRSHIMRQFERADSDSNLIHTGALNFVVVGGGPTGVEMAGALRELFEKVLRKDFPKLDMRQTQVVLLEAMDKLLPPFDAALRQNTLEELQRRGVDVRFNEAVVKVTPDAVHLKSGEVIATQTVVWGAGVKANPLAQVLGVELTRGGRVVVNDDLSIPNHPEAFVIGDMAAGKETGGGVYPQLAQAAIQSGKHVAQQIARKLRNEPTQPFAYKDPGFMATIGRNAAVAQFPNGLKFRGFVAWLMWVGLHLVFLIGFRNKAQVFLNWVWNYATYDRGARLIVGQK
jgi:NADH dehydrogenase